MCRCPLPFIFPTAFADEILFRKNTRESFEFCLVRSFLLQISPLHYPESNPRLRSLRLRLKGPLLRATIRYLLYMLFLLWSQLAVSLLKLVDAQGLAYVVIILQDKRSRSCGNIFIYSIALLLRFSDNRTCYLILLLHKPNNVVSIYVDYFISLQFCPHFFIL